MLTRRLLVAIFLLPIGLWIINRGGVIYVATIAIILGLAAWEYARLFHVGGLQPSDALIVAGTLLLVISRAVDGFQSAHWIISLIIIAAMFYHLVAYERGRDQAATDFAVTLAGVFYLGWIGAYFVSLRDLPEGKWWILVVLPAVWIADAAAYFVGTRFGRHRLCPRLSPKKSWEGYLAGVVFGPLLTAGLAALWQFGAGSSAGITPARGALLGFVLAVLPTLGDLGESMIKRQMGVKDSSHLIPGHGGFFDRIDSWLWGVVIGYYVIVYFFG